MLKVIRPRYDGRVDLGTLSWAKETSSQGVVYFRTYGISSDIAIGEIGKNKISSIKYPSIGCVNTTVATDAMFPNKTITQGLNGYAVSIRDDDYTDATTFKASLSGVYLEYETINQPQKYQLYNAIQPRYDGRLDLGTFSVEYYSGGFIVYISMPDTKPITRGRNIVLTNKNYSNSGISAIENMANKTYQIISSSQIWFKDADYTDATTFKASLSGVYLYFETTTQDKKYQLYNMLSLSMESLLGKQDVGATLNVSSIGWNPYACPTTSNSFGLDATTGVNSMKKISAVNGHKYFVAIKKNGGQIVGNAEFLDADNITDEFFNSNAIEVGSYVIDIIVATKNIKNAVPYIQFYNTQDVLVENMIVIDLTEIGCDNLTAQQFYDRFKDYFPLLASGKNIII